MEQNQTFTKKYTKYSNKEINFLDANIGLTDGKPKTDLFVKSSDTRQFLDSSFSHPHYCKKGILYFQVIILHRIFFSN